MNVIVRVLLEHERRCGLGMDALRSPYRVGTWTSFQFGHGCSRHRIHVEDNCDCGFGMDAVVTVYTWNRSVDALKITSPLI